MTPSELAQLVSGGGVLAFAAVVFYELRSWRPEFKELKAEIKNLGMTMAKLLERERVKDGDTGPITSVNVPRVPTLRRLPTNTDGE